MPKSPKMEEAPLSPKTLAMAIIARQPSGVTQYRMLKLAYLAETRFSAENGRRLSQARYFSFDFGPYSKDLVNAAKGLPASVAKQIKEPTVRGTGEMTRFVPSGGVSPDLSTGVSAFLDSFFSVYGRMQTRDIVAEAYRSGQYPGTPPGEDIDFDRWIARTGAAKSSPEMAAAVDAAARTSKVHSFDTLLQLTSYLAGLDPANA